MFGMGAPELALILVIALIIFGPSKLPQIGASLGKGLRDFKSALQAPDEAPARPAAGRQLPKVAAGAVPAGSIQAAADAVPANTGQVTAGAISAGSAQAAAGSIPANTSRATAGTVPTNAETSQASADTDPKASPSA